MEPRPNEGRRASLEIPENHSQRASVVRLGGGVRGRWPWRCQQGPEAWLVKGLLVEVSEGVGSREEQPAAASLVFGGAKGKRASPT